MIIIDVKRFTTTNSVVFVMSERYCLLLMIFARFRKKKRRGGVKREGCVHKFTKMVTFVSIDFNTTMEKKLDK